MRSSVAAIAAVLALSAPALTPAVALAAPAAKSDAAPSIDMMKRLVKELSSDAYEGRAPGTVGEEKTLALLTVGGAVLTGRFPPQAGVKSGDEVTVSLGAAHMHLFDTETGRALVA